jgi:hypothetical protein
MASCSSRTRHQFISFFIFNPHHHAFPNAFRFHLWKSPSCRTTTYSRPQTPLPNALRKTSAEWYSSAQFGPHVSLFPVPIFGVNICPFNYGIKSDFIPELTTNTQRLQAKSVQHPFFPPSNRWSFRPDPNPSSSTFQASTFKWRTKTKLFR